MNFIEKPYNREMALKYAKEWAYSRNPKYFNFDDLGGDCTNFASQCLYAGSCVMNNTPTYGWYYFSLDNRAPAWTGVTEFYNFITTNKGKGPYGIETTIDKLELGDYVQFASMHEKFHHTVIVVNKNGRPDLRNINIAAHSDDAYNRPLSTYGIRKIRFIKILGVRE